MNSQTLGPCICSLTGFCIVVLGIAIRKKIKASELWPKTVGTIIESTVEPGWTRSGGSKIYVVRPKVIYEYMLGGKKYVSSQLALVEFNSANENSAREKSNEHPVGQQVTVYYNPQKPESATLEVGDPTGGKLPFGMMIVGATVMIVGIVWFLTNSE